MANQPSVIRSGVKTGQQTVEMTANDLDNRIINIRFIHKPLVEGGVQKTFTLRSDYEVVYDKNGTGFSYQVCKQKPAIRISYSLVSSKTITELDIDITNLFIKDLAGVERANGVIETVQVQVGYMSQMPNWESDPVWSKKPISSFYALEDSQITTSTDDRVTSAWITARVLTIQRISMPPDMVTRVQCVVGSLAHGLRWVADGASTIEYKSTDKSSLWDGKEPWNNLPATFFETITRRFIRSGITHTVVANEYIVPPDYAVIAGAKPSMQQTVTIYEEPDKPNTLTLQQGKMSVEDANKYGVIIYMSKVLWEYTIDELPLWGMTDAELANVKPITHPIFMEQLDIVTAQLKAITDQYPFICQILLANGNYYLYHVRESDNDLFRDPFVNMKQNKRIYKLPAVYDITWSGTRTIRAPFFSAIGPMDTVAFQSKYVLNDLVGDYYQPQPKNNCYLVFMVEIVFATVGKENMMTLSCIDIEGEYTPNTLPDGSILPAQLPAYVAPAVRNKIWKKVDLTVVYVYKGDAYTVDRNWASIVDLLLKSAVRYYDRWKDAHGAPPTVTQALDQLKAWNNESSDVFSSDRLSSGTPSPETDTLGYEVPLLYGRERNPVNPGVGDVVHIQYPFLPTYDNKEAL